MVRIRLLIADEVGHDSRTAVGDVPKMLLSSRWAGFQSNPRGAEERQGHPDCIETPRLVVEPPRTAVADATITNSPTHHRGVSAGLDRSYSWACVFHIEGCRAVAQLCQLWCGSATPRGRASSHVLTTHSSGPHWSGPWHTPDTWSGERSAWKLRRPSRRGLGCSVAPASGNCHPGPHSTSFMRRQRPPRAQWLGRLVILQRPAAQETRRRRRPGTN